MIKVYESSVSLDRAKEIVKRDLQEMNDAVLAVIDKCETINEIYDVEEMIATAMQYIKWGDWLWLK